MGDSNRYSKLSSNYELERKFQNEDAQAQIAAIQNAPPGLVGQMSRALLDAAGDTNRPDISSEQSFLASIGQGLNHSEEDRKQAKINEVLNYTNKVNESVTQSIRDRNKVAQAGEDVLHKVVAYLRMANDLQPMERNYVVSNIISELSNKTGQNIALMSIDGDNPTNVMVINRDTGEYSLLDLSLVGANEENQQQALYQNQVAGIREREAKEREAQLQQDTLDHSKEINSPKAIMTKAHLQEQAKQLPKWKKEVRQAQQVYDNAEEMLKIVKANPWMLTSSKFSAWIQANPNPGEWDLKQEIARHWDGERAGLVEQVVKLRARGLADVFTGQARQPVKVVEQEIKAIPSPWAFRTTDNYETTIRQWQSSAAKIMENVTRDIEHVEYLAQQYGADAVQQNNLGRKKMGKVASSQNSGLKKWRPVR